MIQKLVTEKHFSLSFEIFPMRSTTNKSLRIILKMIVKLERYHPDFISVTFGVGGINKKNATEIANYIKIIGSRALSHITAVGYTKKEVKRVLSDLYIAEVRNILALRGDISPGLKSAQNKKPDFKYARDLIKYIKEDGRFCIGAAVYPEGHPECPDLNKNMDYFEQKIDAGASFFITQVFFDNTRFFNFIKQVRKRKLDHVKIIPGIMPIYDKSLLEKILSLSKASIPNNLKHILETYDGEDFTKAGMEFSITQVDNLLKNLPENSGIHLYTMNKVKYVREIIKTLNIV